MYYLNKIFILTCILFFSKLSYSQVYDPEKINKKAIEVYSKAIEELQYGEVKNAIPLLSKALELDKNYVDAYLSLAGVYGELKNYSKSVELYSIAQQKDTGYFKYYKLPYSINLAGLGRFDQALKMVREFLLIPNLGEKSIKSGQYRQSTYQFAIDFAKNHPDTYLFSPENLGDNVNTSFSEYYPSFTIDDSILVFTRRGDGIREDFIESGISRDGFKKSVLIQGTLNEQPSKGGINISQDGEWLVFAGNFGNQGFGDFDIYISYNTPGGWSDPINLGPNINTDFWESSPCLSPDKNTLYFSSNRPGGFGGKDLYVSHRKQNGTWSKAENMGASVNTAGDELAPFIHADNQTLFYTSNGLPGYGGTDIYVMRKKGNGEWGIPENLGYPINTIENEGSLFVASDGITAYYASDRADSRGGLDLYRFTLPQDTRPIKTLYVQGNVYDSISKKNIPCAVELSDDSTQQIITHIQTDETGFYFITLPVGKNYTLTVNRKGYLFYSDTFNLQSKEAFTTVVKNIPLQPLALNATVILKNIHFETNSFHLLPVSLIELEKLVQLMQDNTQIKVLVSGHTDNVGDSKDNLVLSDHRAKAVVDYLIQKGIDAKRLTWKGFGETKPLATNDTEEGRAENRRTEFTIMGMD
ncbi:MAG: PD40 domain-containing protein [Bacteroidetes bacterium]|nr:PD40 domain-containing protein [Bacteroidota bacterium]